MKLISWNIQWCRGCDGRVDPARIARVAREMADFDVLCLQEIASNYPDLAGSAGENQYEALARLLPRYSVVKGVATESAAELRYVMFLNKGPSVTNFGDTYALADGPSGAFLVQGLLFGT